MTTSQENVANRKILTRVSKTKEMRRLVNVIYSTASEIEQIAQLVNDKFSNIEVDGGSVTDLLVTAGLKGYSEQLYKQEGRIDIPNLQRVDGFVQGVSDRFSELSGTYKEVADVEINIRRDLVPEKVRKKFKRFGYSDYE